MAEFDGRHVVVTGAAGGIGSAVTRAFLVHGAAVSALDIDGEGLADLASGAPGARLLALPVDLTDETAVAGALGEAEGRHGPIEVLANAAGLLRQGRVTDMRLEDFRMMVDVNLTGVFLCCKHAVGRIVEGGAIVNLSSVAAYAGSDGSWAYSATKGAVRSLTVGIAQELAGRGIRVNAVAPGWVDAGFTHEALRAAPDASVLEAAARDAHVLGRMARAEEVAEAFLFLASRERASFVTGTELFVDGGFMIKR